MDRNSALEREYELELRNGAAPPEEELEDTDNQFMSELGDEEDLARELDSRNGDEEFELDDGLAGDGSYGARFYELSLREGEVEAELEQRIGEVLDDIEREYFFGKLGKWAKRVGKSGLVRGLASKAFKFAKGRIPALQAIEGVTQLARGNLRGALGSLAKTAVSLHPAGAAALQGLQALGFQGEADDPQNQEAWQRFAEFAQDAYEELAKRTTMEIDNPVVAADAAHAALKTALARTYGSRAASGGAALRMNGQSRVRKVTIGLNETLVVRAR